MIYFDNNTTTQTAPLVFDAMRPHLNGAEDTDANVIGSARESVAGLIGAAETEEVLFTSSGTESNVLAILRAVGSPEGKHMVTTKVEHRSVRDVCKALEDRGLRISRIDIDRDGNLDLASLRAALNKDTAIVSIMHANNETGNVFPVEAISRIVKAGANTLFHVDGACAAGRIPINLQETLIDLYSISGHKFYGPDAVGALFCSRHAGLALAETVSIAKAAGIGAAAELVQDQSSMTRIGGLRDRLESAILEKIPNTYVYGADASVARLPGTSCIAFENTNGEAITARLDAAGIRVSTSSACSSQDHSASAVLQAMNVPYVQAMGAVTFSLGRDNTAAEVETVIEVLPVIVESLRSIGI